MSIENNNQQQNPQQQSILFIILGWICCGLSLLLVPILFGAGTFIFGFLVRKQPGRETHGFIMMVFAFVGAILGFLIGFIVGANGI